MVDDREQADRGGLEPNQQQLLASLRAQGLEGRRILDIGCGKGRLHHRLLEEGAASVVGVEFSKAWLAEAMALARARGHADRVTYLQGDFTDLAEQIEPADVTILDKVVHCYQEPERLVRQSAARTLSLYALSYPKDLWSLRLLFRVGALVMRFLPFGWWPRFSRPDSIRAWVREAGFDRVAHEETKMWHTELYVRSADPPTAGSVPGGE